MKSDDDLKVALKLSPRSIGSDGFRAWIDELYQKRLEKHARPEDVSFRHTTEPHYARIACPWKKESETGFRGPCPAR